MVFTSPIFLFLFLPVVIFLHALAPRRLRNPLLLVASLVFYSWGEGFYLGLMLFSMVINHRAGLWLEEPGGREHGKLIVALVVAVNLGLLVLFKYSDFLVANVDALLALFGVEGPEIHPVRLPIGISFYTFHAVSYIVDIHRGKARAQRSLMLHGLYISFFPQLVAGPIVRYREICDQLAEREVSVAGFAEGSRRFALGLAKKMLIANPLSRPADAIFALGPAGLDGPTAWLGALCYALQIYFDFSGYSDMAIGMARMFGFRFPENFRYPYAAESITDFWRRWHISLSSWFRDYLYIPLGGNRRGRARELLSLFVVFFLCGLWHGASWTFVVWGLFHGAFLVFERIGPGRAIARAPAPLRHAYALLVVLVGWVFFRAPHLGGAASMISAMSFLRHGAEALGPGAHLDRAVWAAMIAGCVLSAPLFPALERAAKSARERLQGSFAGSLLDAAEVAGVALLLLSSCALVATGTHNPFIYYRF